MTTLQPLPEESLADHVAHQIRSAIADGRYKPGMRLIERHLAGELGVSHIPIREALARLSDEGLIERLPRRGARVAGLTPKELEELSALRIVLEQFVVERVQQRWTPKAEADMKKLVASMIQAAKRGDAARTFELDRRFHEYLWELADNTLLSELVAQLRVRISGFLWAATAALEPSALEQHARTHADLLDAIASGNAKRAKAAAAQHIRTAAERMRSIGAITAPPDRSGS